MTPQIFVDKWKRATLKESAGAQEHFLDLCVLLNQPTPAMADPEGTHYTFERGVRKLGGGEGWADVWKRGHFGWEYKGKRKDLEAAFRQLLLYRVSLENPPLLVVSDLDRFEIHTNFTGTAEKVYSFDLDQLTERADIEAPTDRTTNLEVLERIFTAPDTLNPGLTRETITEDASRRLKAIADSLRQRGIPAPRAAHFLMKLIFCMFAEDIRLLPDKLFSKLLANAGRDATRLTKLLKSLFDAMSKGGDFGADSIQHFNGGLFADGDVIGPLKALEIEELNAANANHNWADVEPSIFGTLFERLLDPTKRTQIGAHYTSREDIETIVKPVVMQPLEHEWEMVQWNCEMQWLKIREESRKQAKSGNIRRNDSKPRRAFDKLLTDFVYRLAHVRILDPACGSGNFLYVAINLLLDLEKEVIAYGAGRGLALLPQVRPTQLYGIEINPYAQQLAQVVIWIGYLQWMHHNGFNPPRDPVLDPIESIQCMDAILDTMDPANPSEPKWPEADFIVSNPPFLGGNLLRSNLGESYVDSLFQVWDKRVPRGADLCCYWFEKGRQMAERRMAKRVGLLATQGIRGGENRSVLTRIKNSGDIFFAQSDRDWVLEGANVHVSMIGFDDGSEKSRQLDGASVPEIHANLRGNSDITAARKLPRNRGLCLRPPEKGGKFEVDEHEAVRMLAAPNPNGRPNSDVLVPWMNAASLVGGRDHYWIIDFPSNSTEAEASQFEMPFACAEERVKEFRQGNRYGSLRDSWWIFRRPGADLRAAQATLPRILWTPMVSKHRIFTWVKSIIQPDKTTYAFARADDEFFGILHSRVHEVWSRAQATQLRERESGLRYTPTSCLETFPFPETTDTQREATSAAARELDQLRDRWLNPPEWTREDILQFPGSINGPWQRYVTNPDSHGIGTVRYSRLVAKDSVALKDLSKRTLTNLYNQKPKWLEIIHSKLDQAVFAAYGWPTNITDEQILEKLLALNLERGDSEA